MGFEGSRLSCILEGSHLKNNNVLYRYGLCVIYSDVSFFDILIVIVSMLIIRLGLQGLIIIGFSTAP